MIWSDLKAWLRDNTKKIPKRAEIDGKTYPDLLFEVTQHTYNIDRMIFKHGSNVKNCRSAIDSKDFLIMIYELYKDNEQKEEKTA